jgi:hypothetical protein
VEPQPPQAPSAATLYALDFSRRLGLIVALLISIIGRRCLREPRLAGLAIPLCTRVSRLGRRFQRLLARLAAGRLPPQRRPGPTSIVPAKAGTQSDPDSRPIPPVAPRPVLPTAHGWLVRVLGYEAAACASQLEHLLAEPGAAELLARVPGAQRFLNPLRRLLGIGAFALRPRAVRPQPAPPAPPQAFEPLGEIVSRSPGYTWYRCPTPPAKRA